MLKFRQVFLLWLVLAPVAPLLGQETATLFGKIRDERNAPIEGAAVSIFGAPGGVSTNAQGEYSLMVPSGKRIVIIVSHISFTNARQAVTLAPGEQRSLDIKLKDNAIVSDTFEVQADELERETPMTRIDPSVVTRIPTPKGGIEGLVLFQGLGVSSNNELSSNYSVRGGSFEENLIYVNGIEIYRPFLVRSGQQEGLSFVNPNMVEAVSFSSGGFEARYGDKLSSVLDIEYKQPKGFGGSVSASLLGAEVHLEGSSKNHRFTHLNAFRYRSNQYVFGGLDTDGSFRPVFADYQTYLTYDLTDELELSFLGTYSRNKYRFVPETRETEFGTISQALRLTIFFEGEEIDDYETGMGALSLNYRPRPNLELRFITSGFRTVESETFDIDGAYRLDELENRLGDENFGEVRLNRGVGSFLDHARNFLEANVVTAEHKGRFYQNDNSWAWGLKYQHDHIEDELREWALIDSVGYSIPNNPSSGEVGLDEVIRADNKVVSNRLMGYLQKNYHFALDSHAVTLIGGARFNYWDFNEQTLVSPRVSIAIKPNWAKDWLFRASWGYYQQAPFYREMRNLFGEVNPNIKAQTAIHYVLGMDRNFKAWGRPFKFVTEVYYKQLENLIPYELDNVRIRYYATNNASGYAAGIDAKINGEFVPGVQSWANISVMSTREDLNDDFYVTRFNAAGEEIIPRFTEDQVAVDSTITNPGYIPRPTDQRVTFNLFFQDYLPGRENFTMHLNLLYGSGLPFGPPSFDRFKDTLRIPSYRRVDIGFSVQLWGKESFKKRPNSSFRHFKSIWLTAEVFNLLQINNTISYLWVRDINNAEYGVPNFLTSRRLNVKLIANF